MSDCTRKNNCIVFVLFGISVLLRFLLGNFYPRTINCYPDEWLYLSAAESLWNHHEILVYNMPSSFSKVGYPWLIAPSFVFANLKTRGMVIALINGVVISLGIFPVYGLARRLLTEQRKVLLCVMLYVISPTLTYSMTYMSEVLYIPLALFLIYFIYLFLTETSRKKRLFIGIGLLVLMYPAFLTKSQALAFPLALMLSYLTFWIAGGEKKWKWIGIGTLIVGCIVGVVFVQRGFLGIDIGYFTTRISYALFGALFFIVITVLAFCILPVLMPAMGFSSLDKEAKRLYIFLIYLVLVTAAVVAAMIYVVEDYPSLTPRAHVRYVEYAFVPFVIILLHLLERREKPIAKRVWIPVIGIWSLVLLVCFRGFSGQTVDQTMLFYWQLIAEGGRDFSPVNVRMVSIVIMAMVIALLVLYHKNRTLFQRLIVIGIVAVSLGNSALSVYVQYKTHTHTRQETEEAEQIRDFVREHSAENVLVLEPENQDELLDTFLVDCDNVRTGLQIATTQIEQTYREPSQITYIVAFDRQYGSDRDMELIATFPVLGYSIYQVDK